MSMYIAGRRPGRIAMHVAADEIAVPAIVAVLAGLLYSYMTVSHLFRETKMILMKAAGIQDWRQAKLLLGATSSNLPPSL